MSERSGDGVLAVDLDGTVLGVNTFPSFVRHLSRALLDTREPGPLARLLLVGMLRKARLASHQDLKKAVCAVAPAAPADAVRDWAQSLLAEHGHPEVIDVVRGWRGRVVLTTAAPEVYAVHFGELLGIAEVHGSVLRDGVLTDNVSHGKPLRLRAAGVERVAVFVTDDLVLDAPMAAIADRVYEVRPGGELRECARPVRSALPS